MESVRVLFVGNSHTFFNDMPSIFQMFCKETGTAEAEVVMQAHPGVHLEWHLNQQWELRYALVQGKFDYLVFQQAAHPFPPREETLRDAAKMVELARQCGVKPIATIPWAERRFPESQQERYDTFDLVGEQTGVTLSPVGYVFERVEREEKDIDLYFVDGEHASPYGSYVIAACAFNRIFGRSVIGLPYKSICNVPADRAKFEEIASLRKEAARIGALEAELAALEGIADPKTAAAGLVAEANKLSAEAFAPIWDREKLWMDLDPEKAARLQRIIMEEIEKFDARHAN